MIGYERRHGRSFEAWVLPSAAPWLDDIIASGQTLVEWASARPDAKRLSGRRAVFSVQAPLPGPDERLRWAVRHYVRGGAVAPVLGDRYLALGTKRPEVEVLASVEARARMIPTPAVVAAACYRAGPFYRADLVTEVIPEARPLGRSLFDRPRGPESLRHLTRAGRLVREIGQKGLRHPDLNAMNVLIAAGNDGLDAFVVDLDRARVSDVGGGHPGASMIGRLERSLRRLGAASQAPLSDAEWSALSGGFRGLA